MSLLVGGFIRYACCDFAKKQKSDFPEIWHSCSVSVQNFTITHREVNVKVEGQSALMKIFQFSLAMV